jgi:biotin carboxylase
MIRKLLVLAASQYQLETITRARQLGYYVITVDNRPHNPGHRLADKSYNVDTTDMDAVLEVANREKIQGIISPCTDVSVPTAAYVAEQLGLKGPPLESANIVCSKMLFREFLNDREFPTPDFLKVDSGFNPQDELFKHGEWILKPDCSSGSKGVFIIRSKAELLLRLPETLSFSPEGCGLLERYIHGSQGTCEGFLRQGDLAFACVLDRQTAPPPYVTTCGHCLPSKLGTKLTAALLAQLRNIWRLLGITDGPFDCDFVATDDEVYLLEISPRMGGNCISSLLQRALNFDIVEHSIQHAMGVDIGLPTITGARPAAAVIFGVSEQGRLFYNIQEAEALKREAWVDSLFFDQECGSPVAPFVNSRNRVGHAIVFGDDRADVEAKVQELRKRLCITASSTTSGISDPE